MTSLILETSFQRLEVTHFSFVRVLIKNNLFLLTFQQNLIFQEPKLVLWCTNRGLEIFGARSTLSRGQAQNIMSQRQAAHRRHKAVVFYLQLGLLSATPRQNITKDVTGTKASIRGSTKFPRSIVEEKTATSAQWHVSCSSVSFVFKALGSNKMTAAFKSAESESALREHSGRKKYRAHPDHSPQPIEDHYDSAPPLTQRHDIENSIPINR